MSDHTSIKTLEKYLQREGSQTVFPSGIGMRLRVPGPDAACVFSQLKEHGAYLLTMVGVDERPISGEFAVYGVFMLPGEHPLCELKVLVDADRPVYPSLTPFFPSAHWLERELKDMLGIIPQGHPDLRRLALHPDWPEGVYPLRKDF